jgi:hypothetical protein
VSDDPARRDAAPLVIPRAPETLRLAIDRHWNGAASRDPRLRGELLLSARTEGLALEAALPHQQPARIPAAPAGARVANLWEYDVVEGFLVGVDGRYVEVELGAGGHFLVLEFSAPRRLADEHAGLVPGLDFVRSAAGWRSTLVLPWTLVPRELCALGAFAIAGGAFLAAHPLPGPAPDFHQPGAYPRARLAARGA